MQIYRTTELPEGFNVTEVMSFFTTCFDRSSITKGRRETYPFWAMMYTISGNITFSVGDELFEVKSGEVFFYPPDVPHSIVAFEGKSWEVSFMTFKCLGDKIKSLRGRVLTPDRETTEQIIRLFAECGEHFYNLPVMDGIIGMHCSADSDELLRLKIMTESVLLGLYKNGAGERTGRSHAVFSAAVAYMQSRVGEKITLPQLALELGVSVSTLKAAFFKESGGGVNSYYIDMKLRRGAEWLCGTAMTVGEIAEQLGFSSQFYFSELFKKRYGISPLTYRKMQESGYEGFL
jgi:AraC-like DNA-binding protein